MMDVPLTVPAMLRRTAVHFLAQEIIARSRDGTTRHCSYDSCLVKARQLGQALRNIGIPKGTPVATLCWNQPEHLECYFGIPSAGMVLHPLNLRLPIPELGYIMEDAGDAALIVDRELLPLLDNLPARQLPHHVIVIGAEPGERPGTLDYDQLLGSVTDSGDWPLILRESDAAALSYTSGTTGRPKGVVYSHRAITLHSMLSALPDVFNLGERDRILPAIPMFHANAWGLPYTAALIGASLILTRNAFDPHSILSLITDERATFAAGVPTIWLGILAALDEYSVRYDLSTLTKVVIGGGACPSTLIEGLEKRHGLSVRTSWGMTELSPVGTIGRPADGVRDASYTDRSRAGKAIPFLEMRIRHGDTLIPWDGLTMGELEVRGPCVASGYHKGAAPESFTADGWFRTGDIVTIDPTGVLTIRDRSKDLIKSGGEWISSVELENALLEHASVREAAVIAVPHEKWQERPLAIVVLKQTHSAEEAELLTFLKTRFPAWYIPDRVIFAHDIPRTGTGKAMKHTLRQQYS